MNVGEIEQEPRARTYTAWHPMLVAMLEHYLPEQYRLVAEYQLSRLPQRADIVVVRLAEQNTGEEQAASGRSQKIPSIIAYLCRHTIIEHKGPTDDIADEDLLTLLGYAYQYMRLVGVAAPSDICLMVIADRLTKSFLDQVARCGGMLAVLGQGVWRGAINGFVLHAVETGEAHKNDRDRLLYAFSRSFLSAPEDVPPLDADEQGVYMMLYQQVEQFRKARGEMAIRDAKQLEAAYEQALQTLMAKMPLEKRLAGLRPEERLVGLRPEERLAGLRPEERLAGLRPEERLAGLRPEELLAALRPEEQEQLKQLLS